MLKKESGKIAQRLRKLLELRQISQANLAEDAGISPQSLTGYLNDVIPPLDKLEALARALHVPCKVLTGETPMPEKQTKEQQACIQRLMFLLYQMSDGDLAAIEAMLQSQYPTKTIAERYSGIYKKMAVLNSCGNELSVLMLIESLEHLLSLAIDYAKNPFVIKVSYSFDIIDAGVNIIIHEIVCDSQALSYQLNINMYHWFAAKMKTRQMELYSGYLLKSLYPAKSFKENLKMSDEALFSAETLNFMFQDDTSEDNVSREESVKQVYDNIKLALEKVLHQGIEESLAKWWSSIVTSFWGDGACDRYTMAEIFLDRKKVELIFELNADNSWEESK